jgi:hypothetical protein
MPGQKGTLWNEFEEGGKYKTNKTHKEAWCKWCINAKAEEFLWLVRIAPDGFLHQKRGRLLKILLLVRQPPSTSPTSLILSMISSTSPKEKGHFGTYFETTELQP